MKKFTVFYRDNEAEAHESPLLFQCHAEDFNHAEEQCLNAYPDCNIVNIFVDNDIT